MTPIQLWGYFKTFFVGSFVLRQCKKWTCNGKHSWKIPSYGQKGTSYMYFLYRQTIVKHKLVIFQLHLGENKFHSMRCRRPLCTIPTGFFEFYSHWNNSLQLHVTQWSDTLFQFQPNNLYLFSLMPSEKQQIPILYSGLTKLLHTMWAC